MLALTVDPSAELLVIDDTLEFHNQRSASVELSEGSHIVALSNDKSAEKRLVDTVEIAAGRTNNKSYRFTVPPKPPSKPQLGELRVGSNPKGATVVIDGEEQQYKTNFAFRLTSGRHIVAARIDLGQGELTKVDTVDITAGKTHRLYFEFE